MSCLNARYSKWLGYEFASCFNPERFPNVEFPNGFYVGTFSGYLKDIVGKRGDNRYVLDLRYRNKDYEAEEQEIEVTLKQFKEFFYDVTVLPPW